MSFLNISDPNKRDLIVKEFLELKKNIRDNLLSERTGEQQLQTDLSKFFKPITETQKATAREIMEGLKPIRKGIENLPHTTQPIGKEEEEEEEENIGEIAKEYLKDPSRDTTFGIRKEKGHHYIGDKHVIVFRNNIITDNEKFEGTPGLWELITSKTPQRFGNEDYENYRRLMLKTNTLYRDNNPKSLYPKSSKGRKWNYLLRPIWYGWKEYQGEGVVVILSDPNALLERLDLLLTSQEAGHTGVRNELVSICDELKRQGVLNMKAYKKLNSIIKK